MKKYVKQRELKHLKKTNEILQSLPPFCKTYINGIESSTAPYTRLQYCRYLETFCLFLKQNNPEIKNITLDTIDCLSPLDIEEYLHFLSYYESDDGSVHQNNENGKASKLSAVKSMYTYFQKRKMIKNNPAALVTPPKLHHKNIITLDPNEIAELLDCIEQGADLSKMESAYFEKTSLRDIAIVTLLLGTGLRVSECVGLDITDIDFDNGCLHVIRKGGNEDKVYFGPEVEEALHDYILNGRPALNKDENSALFLSTRGGKRLGVRGIQTLVKKYCSKYMPHKHLSPHKFRSSYGTALYENTGDIYLVANVLGHKDVSTTTKHYASMSQEQKRKASTAVQLRENKF